jgi:hypothetical protein
MRNMYWSWLCVFMCLVGCGGGSGGGGHTPVTTAPSSQSLSSSVASSSMQSSSAAGYDLVSQGIPQFVMHNYLELTKLRKISKFRSGQGHSYTDAHESCRSMKHYFAFPDETVAIYAPVTGKVDKIFEEWAGSQIAIRAQDFPDFVFVIFHVNLSAPLVLGDEVVAGQLLGHHIGSFTSSDIAVKVDTPDGLTLVSYFQTLTNEAFSAYVDRGIGAPEQLIITREERDLKSLVCDGETFVGEDPIAVQWIELN